MDYDGSSGMVAEAKIIMIKSVEQELDEYYH